MNLSDDPLLGSLIVAGLVWAALVPVIVLLALRDRISDPRRRVRLALVISGWTLLWLATVGGIAGIALAKGGRAGLAIALMWLMFLGFGAASLPVRARIAGARPVPWPRRPGAGSRASG